MVTPRQGEIRWTEAEDKRRPVRVVIRTEAIPVLNWILAAPLTRIILGIPTEDPLDEGHVSICRCVASFDNLQLIRKTFLTSRVGSLPFPRREIRRPLAALADC